MPKVNAKAHMLYLYQLEHLLDPQVVHPQ